MTTTKQKCITLSAKEAGEVLFKALSDKFDPKSTVRVNFNLETEYDDMQGPGRQTVKSVDVIGETVEKTDDSS